MATKKKAKKARKTARKVNIQTAFAAFKKAAEAAIEEYEKRQPTTLSDLAVQLRELAYQLEDCE